MASGLVLSHDAFIRTALEDRQPNVAHRAGKCGIGFPNCDKLHTCAAR